jgi:hypothetical protein
VNTYLQGSQQNVLRSVGTSSRHIAAASVMVLPHLGQLGFFMTLVRREAQSP